MARKTRWEPIDKGVPTDVELIVFGPKIGVYPIFVVLKAETDADGGEVAVAYHANDGRPVQPHVVNDVTHFVRAPTSKQVPQ